MNAWDEIQIEEIFHEEDEKLEHLLNFFNSAERAVRKLDLPGDPDIADAYREGALATFAFLKNYTTALRKIF